MPSDKGASRFDAARNAWEFEQIHGFAHNTVTDSEYWHPTVQDLRDNRDPAAIGRKILGRKRVLAAADRAC